MARGSKRSYTQKQKRQAQHIEEGYEARGVPKETAEARAWATVNKTDGGGKKSGSGRARPTKKTVKKVPMSRKTTAKKAARKVAKKAARRPAAKKTGRTSATKKVTRKQTSR